MSIRVIFGVGVVFWELSENKKGRKKLQSNKTTNLASIHVVFKIYS